MYVICKASFFNELSKTAKTNANHFQFRNELSGQTKTKCEFTCSSSIVASEPLQGKFMPIIIMLLSH